MSAREKLRELIATGDWRQVIQPRQALQNLVARAIEPDAWLTYDAWWSSRVSALECGLGKHVTQAEQEMFDATRSSVERAAMILALIEAFDARPADEFANEAAP